MENIIGQKIGKLTVESICEDNKLYAICKCDCGDTARIRIKELKYRRSCGCISRKMKLRESKTRLYNIWFKMKCRCNKQDDPAYKYYGKRGIRVCDEWMKSFDNFKEWALSNGYTDKLTIERKDVDGNYEPSNCIWIPLSEQKNNTTKSFWIVIDGVRKTMKSWTDETGVPYSTALSRIHRGVDPRLAVTVPTGKMREHSDEERGKKRITRAKHVAQYSKDGKYIRSYDSARQGAIAMNGGIKHSENGITNCCRGVAKSAFGYVWKYEA